MEGKGSVLSKLQRSSISVKDIANQAWCEKQMELNHLLGLKTTRAMAQGMSMHAAMQKRVYVPLGVEPKTYADRFYKIGYENYTSLLTLGEKKICREIRLYGSVNGFKVAGQVDEIRDEGGKAFIIEDKTVNVYKDDLRTSLRMKSDSIQISIYRKLLEEMRSGAYAYENFHNSYKLDGMALSEQFSKGLREIGVVDELTSLKGIYKRMFDALHDMSEISNTLELRYFDRDTNALSSSVKIEYDKESTAKVLREAMGYWAGEREAAPVPESERWKCNMCRFFGKECTVWYSK